jgi:hypothetical protein
MMVAIRRRAALGAAFVLLGVVSAGAAELVPGAVTVVGDKLTCAVTNQSRIPLSVERITYSWRCEQGRGALAHARTLSCQGDCTLGPQTTRQDLGLSTGQCRIVAAGCQATGRVTPPMVPGMPPI